MSEDLRALQLCLLDIGLEFKRVCDENNLQYFLIGGNLLGAVRHLGFIPWDDDMDVGMLRPEYEKFIKIAQKEIKKPFFLQTYNTDENYGFSFAKIRIDGTELIEDYAETSKQHNGVYLDIFPFDVMPDSIIKQKIHYILYKCLKWAALGKNDYRFVDKKKKRFAKAMSILFFPLDKKRCLRLADKVCMMYSNSKSGRSINMLGAYQYNDYCNTEDLINLTTIMFEGYEFKAPSHYKNFLAHVYGDYMKLPPEEKRRSHHKHVDLGDYRIHNSASVKRVGSN